MTTAAPKMTPPAASSTPSAMMAGGKKGKTDPKNTLSGPAAQKFGWWWGTGRRKTAVARVRLRPGSGKVTVNKKEVDAYFTEISDRNDAVAPLRTTDMMGKVEVIVTVKGGGFGGQADAVKLGIARALKLYDVNLEQALRDKGYLTRDAREVERKKYGQAGARRRFQFSKR